MDTSKPRQFLSRDQVLIGYAAEMIARSSFSQDDFAQALSLALYRCVPDKARRKDVPDFEALARTNDTAAFLRASGTWLRRVARWLAGDVELPCWIEEPWVQALQGEFQERCLNELAGRHGLSGARAMEVEACSPVGGFGALVTRLGQAVQLGSEILADGRIGDEDLPVLQGFVDSLAAAEARCAELRCMAIAAQAVLTAADVASAGPAVVPLSGGQRG